MGLSHDASSAFADDADFSLPEKKGKMRKLDTSQAGDESSSAVVEKKPRKKWSSEETQMLVKGCNKVRHCLYRFWLYLIIFHSL